VFERIVGQDIAVRMLRHEVDRGTLPQVLLFHGPPSSGKFLTALELSRILNCERGGAAGCVCPACVSVERLGSPNLYILCGTNLEDTFQLWKTFGVKASNRGAFLRDCRRYYLDIRDESKYASEAEQAADYLRRWGGPGSALPPRGDEERERDTCEIIDAALNVYSSLESRVIGIDSVREVQRYLSMKSASGRPRVVIIDGAEAMSEESANSFLRISEDTPAGAVIVLTAVDKKRLKETIVSRCRCYRFKDLSTDIRQRVFDSLDFDADRLPKARETRRAELDTCLRMIEESGGLYEAVQEIVRRGLTLDFVEVTREKLRRRYITDTTLPPGELEDIDGILKKLSALRTGVLHRHANPETALTDFLLNYNGKTVHLTGER
jgi:DNA polymerase III delta prime subunit